MPCHYLLWWQFYSVPLLLSAGTLVELLLLPQCQPSRPGMQVQRFLHQNQNAEFCAVATRSVWVWVFDGFMALWYVFFFGARRARKYLVPWPPCRRHRPTQWSQTWLQGMRMPLTQKELQLWSASSKSGSHSDLMRCKKWKLAGCRVGGSSYGCFLSVMRYLKKDGIDGIYLNEEYLS